jgi:hypothetical protein
MRNRGQTSRCLPIFALLLACSDVGARGQTASAANQASSATPDYNVTTVKVNNTGNGSSRIDISDDILRAGTFCGEDRY